MVAGGFVVLTAGAMMLAALATFVTLRSSVWPTLYRRRKARDATR